MVSYLGIDPGKAGGFALLDCDGHLGRVKLWKMPETERETWDLVVGFNHLEVLVMLEAVHSMPKDGVASAFKFGTNYGFLRGCLTAAGLVFHEVTPAKWKGALGLKRKDGETIGKFKARSRQMAQRLYPGAGRIINATAEALLLAHYCKETVTP